MKKNFSMVVILWWRFLYSGIWRVLDVLKTRAYVWVWGVREDGNLSFRGPVRLAAERSGSFRFGRNVKFWSHRWINPIGLLGPTMLTTARDGFIEIGDDSAFSSVVIFSCCGVKIGRRAVFGGNVRIFDTNFHVLDAVQRWKSDSLELAKCAPVIVGDDVFVGANAMILKGTRIGDRSIVAAGSVVFGLNVPPDSLVKGNPAEIVSRQKG